MGGGSGTGRRAAAWAAALGTAALLGLAGCTGGGGDTASGGGADQAASGGGADQAASGGGADQTASGGGGSGMHSAVGTVDQAAAEKPGSIGIGAQPLDLAEPALIRTAEMTVRVDDVAARARQAQDRARTAGGSVAGDDRSGSGDQARADLVLKVLPGRLDGVLDQLGALGEETQRRSSTENVTEQVADVESRVATMQASIARIRAILSRATRIGDVVSVEGELSRRVTELESLQARQRALAGQVGMATVTLHLVARGAPAAADRGGFLGGLQDGWSAFTRTLGWLLAALGAVLPFLLVVLPVLLATRWYVRRQRRPQPAPAAASGTGGP